MTSLLRDIEVKVTNTANKPIYYLELGIVLSENLSPAGYPIDFPLPYGREDLIRFETPVGPNDKPLRSGESSVLRIPEKYLVGFEKLRAQGPISQAEVRKVYLMFRHLNFGDQTGFSGDGSPVPFIRGSSVNDCFEGRGFNAHLSFKSGAVPDLLNGVRS